MCACKEELEVNEGGEVAMSAVVMEWKYDWGG